MSDPKNAQRRCPGEKAVIGAAICAARQKHKYGKCVDCECRDESKASREGAVPPEAAKVFKAYDIRGVYGIELNEKLAEMIGAATARFLGARTLAVSHDMRSSSPALADALTNGMRLAGCDVIDIGLASTDANYFASGYFDVDGAVQTTASHNPAQYNGFKISRRGAVPVGSDSGLENIRSLALGPPLRPAERRGGQDTRDILMPFRDHVLGFARSVPPLKVVIDAGNGMAGHMLPPILERLPIQVMPLYFELDGTFPNHEANPLKEENMRDLQAAVREEGADLGVAFDGDGDRCAFTDEQGNLVSCDFVTALIARLLLRERGKSTIVYDVRSSRVVAEEIRKAGGEPLRDRVGHAFIKATMRRTDAVFGGELSGHYYFRDNYYADSGVIAMVMMLNLLGKERRPFSEVLAPLHRYCASGEINYEVGDKQAVIAELGKVFNDGNIDYMDGITVEYDDWWFNVRASNTEAVLRLNLEAADREQMGKRKQQVERVIYAEGAEEA